MPEGWIPLFDAYQQVGKTQYGDEWMDGKELAARSAAEIAQPRAPLRQEQVVSKSSSGMPIPISEKQLRAINARRNQIPQLFSSKDAEVAARERGDRIWNQLRQWLFAEQVPSIVLDENGRQHSPDPSLWAKTGAKSALHTGRTMVGLQSGYVLLSQPHLEAAIKGKGITPDATDTGLKDDDAPIHEQTIVTGEKPQPRPTPRRQPRPQLGAPPKYAWAAFDKEIKRIKKSDGGLPETQADLEGMMLQWCEDKWDRQPGLSTVRERLSPIYQELRRKKGQEFQ